MYEMNQQGGRWMKSFCIRKCKKESGAMKGKDLSKLLVFSQANQNIISHLGFRRKTLFCKTHLKCIISNEVFMFL